MAPAASIHAAATSAAAASKRPAASDAEQLVLPADSSSALPQQVDDEAARSNSNGKSKSQSQSQSQSQEQQPMQKQQLECPRCRSTNTKFCYYNNYSTAQPRHFCRACRRYWTHGGTLRDVPVGGATRRAKRRRLSSDEPEPSAPSPPPQMMTAQDACPPDLSNNTAFPFLSDGSYYLPQQQQLDLGFFAAPAAWPSSGLPDFYDGLAPWDVHGTVAGDIAGLDFTWPPPGQLN